MFNNIINFQNNRSFILNNIRFIFVFFAIFKVFSIKPSWQFYQPKISKSNIKTRQLQYGFIFGDAQFFELELNEAKRNISCIFAPIFLASDLRNNNFADAFLINRKSELLMAGDNTPYLNNRDLRAEFFDGTDSTVTNLSLNPSQDIFGIKFLIQLPLSTIIKSDCLPNWAIGLRPTIVYLKNKLDLMLNGLNSNNFPSIRNFFANKTENARIDGQERTNIGFESFALTLEGLYKTKKEKVKIYYYTGLEIPLSETFTTPYLFYPYVGNNGNIATLLGFYFHGNFYEDQYSNKYGILLEIEDHFLFYKTTNRVFDIYGKPWSRYLPTTRIAGNTTDNTIGKDISSISNLPVRVHPCNSIDGSIGLIYKNENLRVGDLTISAGYNLWVAQGEYSEFQDRVYRNQYQNFYSYGIKGNEDGTTASNDTISKLSDDDLSVINFNINNLDIQSVSASGGHSQSYFLRLTLQSNDYDFIFGGWQEFGSPRLMPSRYGFWFGLGANW